MLTSQTLVCVDYKHTVWSSLQLILAKNHQVTQKKVCLITVHFVFVYHLGINSSEIVKANKPPRKKES